MRAALAVPAAAPAAGCVPCPTNQPAPLLPGLALAQMVFDIVGGECRGPEQQGARWLGTCTRRRRRCQQLSFLPDPLSALPAACS